MWIVKLALRRPYTFVVGALVLLILTPFVLLTTPTDIFPEINIPVISVVWTYNGLNAREMEERIIYISERQISTLVNDIEHIESTAYNGAGVIKVFLQPGASVSDGVAQITASGQTVLRFLPPGITPPFIIRYNASSVPILQYSLASKKFSEQELQDMAINRVKIGLSTVRGASVPYPAGGKTRVVAVDIDLAALKAKNLAPQDVVNAFNAQNFVLPSGTAKIGETEYNVSLNSNPAVLAALNELPVKTVNGAVIRVGDVAQVHDGYQPQQNIVRLDGVRGVLLTIFKSGAASTLSVVDGVKKAMPTILSGLPPELESKEFADQSLFVRAAVRGVVQEGVIAALLTAVMILLFLGSWRSTFIIALSIPLSVLSSILLLSALGETINLMTLGGLALAVGILVDDATVTIENIHRHMALGKPNEQSILDGAQEIALPALVSTLCISIVFVPMFFLTGVSRYLFVPLAEAVVFADAGKLCALTDSHPDPGHVVLPPHRVSGPCGRSGNILALAAPVCGLATPVRTWFRPVHGRLPPDAGSRFGPSGSLRVPLPDLLRRHLAAHPSTRTRLLPGRRRRSIPIARPRSRRHANRRDHSARGPNRGGDPRRDPCP